jgi:predicted dehydrogenase
VEKGEKMDSVSWGFIGCGNVAEVKSGPAFSRIKDSSVTAVMRRDADKAKDYAKRHGIPKWYSEADKLINDSDINAIYIATPPDVHLKYTKMCAAAGKSVYVEKPMARTYSEAKEMVKVCREANVSLFVAHYRRRLPRFLKIKEIVENGVIGEIRSVNLAMYKYPSKVDYDKNNLPWRVLPEIAGGGYFYDLAPHQLDILDYIISPFSDVKGLAANLAGLYPAEDTVSAAFRFESGALGTGMWCFAASEEESIDRVEIIGNKGALRFAIFETTPIELYADGKVEYLDLPTPQHIQQPLIETIVADLLGRGECPSTGESALRTARVMEEIVYGRILD